MMKYTVLVLCVGLSLLMVVSGMEHKANAVNPKSINLLVRTVREAVMSKRSCGSYGDKCVDDPDCCDGYECDYGSGNTGACKKDWRK